MPYRIITHDGKAHIDELIGAALLAIYNEEEPETIERIEPRDAEAIVAGEELPKNTWFIDCGMVYDTSRRLFDHHQDRDCDSTALLIFNEFFPSLEGTDLHDFIKLVSRVDTQGAMSLDDFNSLSESREYLYFSHNILLRSFQKDPLPVLRLVIDGLTDRMAFEEAKKEASAWLEKPGHIEIAEAAGLKILLYLQKPPKDLVQPLRSVINELVEANDASAILSFDNKQPEVRTFYRTDIGHDRIDFSQSKPGQKLFCHPGGFLMKFIPEGEDEWRRLVEESKK